MSFNDNTPDDNNVPLPPEFANGQGGNLNDNMLRRAKWLRGFRIDNAHGPQVAIQQVASCVDRATPLIEEMSDISTEIIVTSTERETNYVHCGWSIGAVRTVSPWISSRITANSQLDPDAEGTWYTRMTRSKRFKIQTLLEDLAPVPEFEAAIEEALRQPTIYEKFQAVYRALARWGDVLPLEIELGSSLALSDSDMDRVQFQLPETGGRKYNNITWLSMFKTADITLTGDDLWNDGSWTTTETRDHQWQVITIGKVISTIDLLPGDLQTRLSELYAQRLSYFPAYGIGRIRNCHRTYDDNQHASKTISNVTVRSSDYIELLSITYSDGTTSSRHGGGGHVGTVYKFTLETGEHIIEMLTWTDGNWLFGLQFVTNMGRCSPQYGAHRDIPSIARAKGGVLVGFLSQTNQHPSYKEMFSGVQGIWRRDLLPKIPKEDDVYSEYFGDTHSSWHEPAFNDRVLVGNSKSIYISCVKIWSGDSIDSIQFMYDDSKDGQTFKSMSLRHGGPGGSPNQFVLEDGEHIVTVSGRYGEQRITQLCFATNQGRTSGVFGGGKGQPFSVFAPRDKEGNYFRLQYICGKHSDTWLTGVMFVWTPY
ncbi:jacalin-like lectin domain protein [Rhizoctonia solani AG-3 Rhs1AP]|uniref:Jacalin-like lectin domain protein n=1 Tax=Rhizoctonia solani AG-3 Rhs1AP TaxID=1086054 RepID=X8JC30_9AGAM|nr:jacalin-like lectin domain protein [Rhizoctonia solani AG-3 Rhs1AP]